MWPEINQVEEGNWSSDLVYVPEEPPYFLILLTLLLTVTTSTGFSIGQSIGHTPNFSNKLVILKVVGLRYLSNIKPQMATDIDLFWLSEGKPTRMRRLCLLGITSSSEEVYELIH